MNSIRTYHPDIDIPVEIIMDELIYDDRVREQRATFDPYAGNLLSATFCFEGIRKKTVAVAFPTGPLGCDLSAFLHSI